MRIAGLDIIVANHGVHSGFTADEDDHFFGSGDGGIEEVAGGEHGGTREDGHDDRIVFAALRFMHGGGISELDIHEVGGVVFQHFFIIEDGCD